MARRILCLCGNPVGLPAGVNHFKCHHCGRALSLAELDRARVTGPGPVLTASQETTPDGSRRQLFWILGLVLSGLAALGVVCLIIILANSGGEQGGFQNPIQNTQPGGKTPIKYNVILNVGGPPPVVTRADDKPSMKLPCSSCGNPFEVKLVGDRWKGICANPACPRPVEFNVPKEGEFKGRPGSKEFRKPSAP